MAIAPLNLNTPSALTPTPTLFFRVHGALDTLHLCASSAIPMLAPTQAHALRAKNAAASEQAVTFGAFVRAVARTEADRKAVARRFYHFLRRFELNQQQLERITLASRLG